MSVGNMENASLDSAESGFEVQLYVYDLSKGLARKLSTALLGREVPGVWHTSIVVRGTEYFFGSTGIDSCPAERTSLQKPDRVVNLGRTEQPHDAFLNYIRELGTSTYKDGTYNLFHHNCNHFTQDVALFLTGQSIPREILSQPDHFLRSPVGSKLVPFFERLVITVDKTLEQGSSGAAQQSSECSRSPEHLYLSKPAGPAHGESPAEPAPEEREHKSDDDQPVFYTGVDGIAAFHELDGHLERTGVTDSERSQLDKLREYLVNGHGAWALGPELLELFEKLLTSHDDNCVARLSLLRVLQATALLKDIILFLHQDHEKHVIMSYVNRIATLSTQEQDEVLKLLCNLCSYIASCEWLLHISEWREDGNAKVCSNAKATVRAVAHGLLCGRRLAQEYGAALAFNLTSTEMFDSVAEELSEAVTQFLQGDVAEKRAYCCLVALHRLLRVSYDEVSVKVQYITPYLEKLADSSVRVKKLVSEIQSRIPASASVPKK